MSTFETVFCAHCRKFIKKPKQLIFFVIYAKINHYKTIGNMCIYYNVVFACFYDGFVTKMGGIMQDSSSMRKNIESFHDCVLGLTKGLADVSGIWKDEKYSDLSKAFTTVANDSRAVIESGSRCCTKFDNFMSIANEKY